MSPLMLAVQENRLSLLELMLEAGADINQRTPVSLGKRYYIWTSVHSGPKWFVEYVHYIEIYQGWVVLSDIINLYATIMGELEQMLRVEASGRMNLIPPEKIKITGPQHKENMKNIQIS